MYLRPLTTELEEKAKNELNDVPCRRETDLQHLREWLAKQPHLKARTDDVWLLNFLRSCKFSQQKTKEKLDFFYTTKSSLPELYSNRDPLQAEIQEVLSKGIILPLSSSDMDILLIRWQNADINKISLLSVIKVGLMMFEIVLNESSTCMIIGQQVVIDFRKLAVGYVTQNSPIFLKNVLTSIFKGYPMRMKGVHHIYCPRPVEALVNMLKPFLSKKIQKRVKFFHEDNINKLYEHIPLSMLPKEYSGDGETIAEITAKWKKKIESYREWFLEDEQYGVDEAKRPEKTKVDFDDIYGIDGSFRSLEID